MSGTRTQVPSSEPGITSPVREHGPGAHLVEVADLEVDDLELTLVGQGALPRELGHQRLRASLDGAVGAVAHHLVQLHLERAGHRLAQLQRLVVAIGEPRSADGNFDGGRARTSR